MSASVAFSVARRRARNVTMETPATCAEPGARWLRCDLHVHTPFDPEKKFGEDIKAAIDALKKAKTERLAQIADRFVQGCRNAANGEGMDLVALTDHNSIDGFRYLSPFFEVLRVQSRDQGLQMPAILPGVEFSVGGEREQFTSSSFSPQTPAPTTSHAPSPTSSVRLTHSIRSWGPLAPLDSP